MLVKLRDPIICSNPTCRGEIQLIKPRKFGIEHKTKCPDCGKTNTYRDDAIPHQQ